MGDAEEANHAEDGALHARYHRLTPVPPGRPTRPGAGMGARAGTRASVSLSPLRRLFAAGATLQKQQLPRPESRKAPP